MKQTMLYVFYRKEFKHWELMGELYKEMVGVGGVLVAYPILVVIITLLHYTFFVMHSLFELILYFFDRKQFKVNLNRMQKSVGLEINNHSLN